VLQAPSVAAHGATKNGWDARSLITAKRQLGVSEEETRAEHILPARLRLRSTLLNPRKQFNI
jgi:hypothetical protein